MDRISGQVDERQGKAHISPLRVRTSVKLESTMETCTAYYNYTFRLIDDFTYQLGIYKSTLSVMGWILDKW